MTDILDDYRYGMGESYYRHNVSEAAEWLDKNYPGWERKVDVSNLRLIDCNECILGQALVDLIRTPQDTGYGVGIDRLIEQALYHKEFVYAFSSPSHEPFWVELIKERFSTGNFSDAS